MSNFKKKKKNSIKRQKQRAMNYVGTMYPKCPEQIKVQVGSRRPEIRSFTCLDEEPARESPPLPVPLAKRRGPIRHHNMIVLGNIIIEHRI